MKAVAGVVASVTLAALSYGVGAMQWASDQRVADTQHDAKYNMVSYQIAELDKRMSSDFARVEARLAKAESSLETGTGWRGTVTSAMAVQAEQTKMLSEQITALRRELADVAPGKRRSQFAPWRFTPYPELVRKR